MRARARMPDYELALHVMTRQISPSLPFAFAAMVLDITSKRQFTWFNAEKDIRWVELESVESFKQFVELILKLVCPLGET